MKVAFPRSAALVPVCRQVGSRFAAYRAGGAERIEGAEGKIKEHGTTSGQFSKLLLSAHCLAAARAARHFLTPRAACLRNALALLDSDRHHGRKSPCFRDFRPAARP
jgi:hypothetical protein